MYGHYLNHDIYRSGLVTLLSEAADTLIIPDTPFETPSITSICTSTRTLPSLESG